MPITSQHERARPHDASLSSLAEYLEVCLDLDASLVIMEPRNGTCAVTVGNPFDAEVDCGPHGALAEAVVDGIFAATSVGNNEVEIDGQAYRFVRTFARLESGNAVIFSPS